MARVEVYGFDDLLKKFDELSKASVLDEAAKRVIDKTSQVVAREMAAAISSREYGEYATGSVSRSIRPTKAKINSYGAYSVAKPTGRDGRGVRNAEKAAYLEYGAKNLPARPWRDKAVRAAEEKALPVMEEAICEELGIERDNQL